MIAVRSLAVHAGSFVLNDVSFEIPDGGYGVLMGRTGAGKTTLLEAICGLRTVSSGSIHVADRCVTQASAAERGIGYVPQDLALFPSLTVHEHLAFALVIRRQANGVVSDRVNELAKLLGLTSLLDRKPRGLSGGEAQRVALGRALSHRPRVLLLDEPLSALDAGTHATLLDMLRDVQRHTGVTTLHVTHNQIEARALATVVLRLDAGRIEKDERTTETQRTQSQEHRVNT